MLPFEEMGSCWASLRDPVSKNKAEQHLRMVPNISGSEDSVYFSHFYFRENALRVLLLGVMLDAVMLHVCCPDVFCLFLRGFSS